MARFEGCALRFDDLFWLSFYLTFDDWKANENYKLRSNKHFERWCNGSVIMMVGRFIFVLLCFYFFFKFILASLWCCICRIVFNFLNAIGSDYKTFSNKNLTEQYEYFGTFNCPGILKNYKKKNNYKNQLIPILQINLDFQIKIKTCMFS